MLKQFKASGLLWHNYIPKGENFMDIFTLFNLQSTLFAMMLIGTWMKKKGIMDENGKRCMTDLCVNIIIPCNILKSFLIEFNLDILKTCGLLFVSAAIMQGICLLLNQWLFNRYPPQRKKVLQYCTLVPMSGFLGNPITEGIYNQIGVLYTSIYLIPMRIMMWSAGTAYFTANTRLSRKKLIKNILTHPCLAAIYIGIFFMITQLPLPRFVTETIRYISSCNSAVTMFIVGTILADVKLSSIFSKDTLAFSFFRLIVLPAISLGLGLLLGLDAVSLGISVLMTGMPAGATAAIFAARYESDAAFATKCVVMTTLVSMITLPAWCYIISA